MISLISATLFINFKVTNIERNSTVLCLWAKKATWDMNKFSQKKQKNQAKFGEPTNHVRRF